MLIDNRILYNSYTLSLLKTKYTINIPFICQKCGRCCNWGYPPTKINENALSLIGYPNNKSGKEKPIKKIYDKLLPSELCLFYENGSCKIYPYRPEECRHYPLGGVERDTKTNTVLCPGRKRFDEIETNITQKYGTYKKTPYHKEIGEINIEYTPKDEQWEETLNNFNKSKPNQNEIKLFLKTNKRK